MTTRTRRWDEEDGVARRAVDEAVVLAALVGQRLGRGAGQVVRAARRTALHLGTALTAAAVESARAGGRAAVQGAHRVTGSPRPRPRVHWPWVFAGVAITATVAAALARRGPVAPPPAPAPPRVQDVRAETEGPDGPAGVGHDLPGLEAPGRQTPGPEPVRAPTS